MSDDDMYEDVVDSEEEEECSDDENIMDEDPLADCSVNAYKPIRLERSNSFEVMDKTDLSSQSSKLIDEVIDVLGISHPAASTLLRYMKWVLKIYIFYTSLTPYRWNKEKLIEKYMDNSEKLCMEAGIPQLALEKPPSAQKVSRPYITIIIYDTDFY